MGRSVAGLVAATVDAARQAPARDATLPEVASQVSTQLVAVINLGDAAVALLSILPDSTPEAKAQLSAAILPARRLQALVTAAAARDVEGIFEQLMLHMGRGCAVKPCVELPKELLAWGGLIVTVDRKSVV